MVPPGGAEGYQVKSGLRNGNVPKRSPWETVLPRFTDARQSWTDQPGSRTAGRARPGSPGLNTGLSPFPFGYSPDYSACDCDATMSPRAGCARLSGPGDSRVRGSAPRSHDEEEARHPEVNGRLLRAASGVGASGRLSRKGEGAMVERRR